MLTDRLERLAVAVERGDTTGRELPDRFELASFATRHAVRLELLSPEQADSIWNAARRKHPAAFATSRS
jgi:hypothetical protein